MLHIFIHYLREIEEMYHRKDISSSRTLLIVVITYFSEKSPCWIIILTNTAKGEEGGHQVPVAKHHSFSKYHSFQRDGCQEVAISNNQSYQ